MNRAATLCAVVLLTPLPLRAADYPAPTQADSVLRDFRFASGESLPELRLHYRAITLAQPRLRPEGLAANPLRLVLGPSRGGMPTWLWGETHPDFMDALLPLASLPTQIAGRNRVWGRMVSDAIRHDPGWKN